MGDNLINLGVGFESGLLLIVVFVAIISFLVSLILIASNIKIFIKGNKPWWASLIPIYNIIVLMDIAQVNYLNLLFLLIPGLGMVIFYIILFMGLAKRFNKSTGFTIGLILLPYIFLPILAFSNDEVNEIVDNSSNVEVSENNQEIVNEIGDVSNMNSNLNLSIQSNDILQSRIEDNNSAIDSNLEVLNSTNDFLESGVLSTVNNQIESLDNLSYDNNVSSGFEQLDISQIGGVGSNNDVQALNSNNFVPEDRVVNNENYVIKSNNTNAKFCRGCGNEIPSIVTICPKCGTDNE